MASLFNHICDFYEALLSEAKEEDVEGANVMVYRGKVTELYRSLKISQTHYSKIRSVLIELGSVVIIRQGSRDNDTVIALYRPPDEDAFKSIVSKDLTRGTSRGKLLARVQKLEDTIGGIDVKKAFIEHQQLLDSLEREVKELKREVESFGKTKGKKGNIKY